MFTRLRLGKVSFNSKTIEKGHQLITYRGVKMIKCPFDYVIYQMIINQVRPDLVIEIGTHAGGNALYVADLMDSSDITGEIHTIDIVDLCDEKVKKNKRIKRFLNGWENYDINLSSNFKTILIIEDGSHTYEHTIGILRKFGSIVSKGSYFIIEDSIITKLKRSKKFNGGPLKAIYDFFKEDNSFSIDRKWCDMFGKNATFNVNGYLRKK